MDYDPAAKTFNLNLADCEALGLQPDCLHWPLDNAHGLIDTIKKATDGIDAQQAASLGLPGPAQQAEKQRQEHKRKTLDALWKQVTPHIDTGMSVADSVDFANLLRKARENGIDGV